MQQTRRNWLRATAAAVASVAVAGCGATSDDEEEPDTDEESPADDETDTPDDTENASDAEFDAVEVGVVSEWNAIRTRLRDPVILGHAGEFTAGASVVGDIFERFEVASGENNAHEMLEETSESNYEGFENALDDLRSALETEDLEGAHSAMRTADKNLRQAQAALSSEETVQKLSLLVMGAHVEDAALLLQVGAVEDAEHEFSHIGDKFEESGLYDLVAAENREAADEFVDATDRAANAAGTDDAAATQAANDAFEAATQGIHALASESLAGATHMAALQARGWDGATLAQLGGPSRSYAHAVALNGYRARVRDAQWLFERDRQEEAAGVVRRALERFETARAHDALEGASHDSYEAFEGGLETLVEAIEAGEPAAVAEAVTTVEDALRTGVGALVNGDQQALIEAGYTKSRIEGSVERYRLGDAQRATELAEDIFADFEADAGGFHEALEEADEELYDQFEHDHLEGLIEALDARDDDAVTTHAEGLRETLLNFETTVGSRAAVSGVESSYLAARALDAAVLAQLGSAELGKDTVSETFAYFESGAGGFHDALEEADHGTYESFEGALETLQENLTGDPTARAEAFTERASDASYTIIESGGSGGSGATTMVRDVFEHFEGAAVHDMVEDADHDTYEAFEDALEEYIETLSSGGGVQEAADRYARATLRAQFAIAGAAEEAPTDATESGDESNEQLEGGPNVVDGVPGEADHVVDMTAVAFEPAELTVSQGDTVAWTHAGGEPHSVTAYEDQIPDDAAYWASGGFDSEQAARDGWEEGTGGVQSGESYVHTLETTGTHGYVCIPHEAAGMVGEIIVE